MNDVHDGVHPKPDQSCCSFFQIYIISYTVKLIFVGDEPFKRRHFTEKLEFF